MSIAQSPLALRSRRSIIDNATKGLGSARGAHLSIRGGRFRLINANGVETLLDTHYIDIVIMDANEHPARIYFEGEYDPQSDDPPVCWSDNGVGPSINALMPQAPTCQTCPRNIRGTAQTFTGKATTVCRNAKKVAFIVPDDPQLNVYEFQVTPGSLTNFRDYCKFLASQASGVENRALDIADVVTRVAFDPDKQFVMTFNAVAYADDERTMQVIQYIDDNRLSDQAVGRNDVAVDAEQVKLMLAGRGATQALQAPAQQQEAQAPKPRQTVPAQTLPPRQTVPAQTLPPPAAEPPAPKLRGRAPKAQQALPPAQGEQEVLPPANAVNKPTNGAANGDGMEIPAFLRRTADPQTQTQANPAPAAPPRFGVGAAPPPPAEIADALNKAMSLPTRRA